jgi:hypothetical protein
LTEGGWFASEKYLSELDALSAIDWHLRNCKIKSTLSKKYHLSRLHEAKEDILKIRELLNQS